ncbi:MAG TPA: chromosomal replication initiator protein DnaA [Gammaproteobacteria bacterium]|nr:chromosomal replication initiator protein DnaA [Gammaproteobacteria bacterium]
MTQTIWNKCNDRLADILTPQQFHTWIRPLTARIDLNEVTISAPNRFVLDYVSDKFNKQIKEICAEIIGDDVKITFSNQDAQADKPTALVSKQVEIEQATESVQPENTESNTAPKQEKTRRREDAPGVLDETRLNPTFTFDYYVEGKSNQLARAAARQVAENPGPAYNPLFIYGGVGLGKTHLMHAIGNYVVQQNPRAKVAYLNSQKFVQDMVKALQHNMINRFQTYYRSLNVLLIDDIQFFAKKERSQEEFFHTFNALLEGNQQVVMTCDRYPKEVEGLEERLKSRFGWGLTVAVEPPELETRVAILMNKAQQFDVRIPDDVAFFIAQRVQSNIRELEGTLKLLKANSQFRGQAIDIEFTKATLKDLLSVQDKLVTIENIQKTVCEYYKIRSSDLLSKKRSRSIARPRQIAMALAKNLTNHSLPEIGNAFGGRDHTTVMHACKKVQELRDSDTKVDEDFNNLLRIMTT